MQIVSTRDGNAVADEHVFRSLLEHAGLCVASLDLGLRVVEANDDFVASFGDPRGRSFFELLHPATHAPLRGQFERLLDGRRNRFVRRLAGIGPRGSVFPGDLTGIAVRGSAGQLALILIVVQPEKSEAPAALLDRTRILTELDARILEGIAAGESTARLASRLFLSRQGVEYHVATMLKKLKAPNRVALISKAYSLGALSIASWPPKVSPDFVK